MFQYASRSQKPVRLPSFSTRKLDCSDQADHGEANGMLPQTGGASCDKRATTGDLGIQLVVNNSSFLFQSPRNNVWVNFLLLGCADPAVPNLSRELGGELSQPWVTKRTLCQDCLKLWLVTCSTAWGRGKRFHFDISLGPVYIPFHPHRNTTPGSCGSPEKNKTSCTEMPASGPLQYSFANYVVGRGSQS